MKIQEEDQFIVKHLLHITQENNLKKPCKTSFVCLDKNSPLREYDKSTKCFHYQQKERIPTGNNESLYLNYICNKKYKSLSGLKQHHKNCTQATREKIVEDTLILN